MIGGLWSYRVWQFDVGSLTIGWNSNSEKQISVHDLSLETCRHPPKSSSSKAADFQSKFFDSFN